MDLIHGSVMKNGRELLVDVPVYLSSDRDFVRWGGCLHLHKRFGPEVSEAGVSGEYTILLRDGRLGSIRLRKVVSANDASHIEVLFEGMGPLRPAP